MFEWQFVWDGGPYTTKPSLDIKKWESPRTLNYLSYHFQPLAPFFSLNFVSFPLLADYSSIKFTSEKTIKAAKDCKYLTFTQYMPEASFDLSYAAQTVKFSLDNNALLNK